MKSGSFRLCFSYADDVRTIGIGRSVPDYADIAQREVNDLLEWASRNAVFFDKEKSDLIQLTG